MKMNPQYGYKVMAIVSNGSEYQRGNDNGDTVDLVEWKYAMRAGADVYELGKDGLPEGVEDIRGLIHNEPETVFAVVAHDPAWDSNGVSYWGAVAVNNPIDLLYS